MPTDSAVKTATLGEILLQAKIITAAQIETALNEQKRSGLRFGKALISLGIVTKEDIDWALSSQLGIPFIKPKKELIDAAALEEIPARICRTYELLPLIKTDDELSIAMSDPLDKEAISAVGLFSNLPLNISLASTADILKMIDELYGFDDEARLDFDSPLFNVKELETIRNDGSARLLLERLFNHLVRLNLSSLSLQPEAESVIIHGRLAGHRQLIGRLAKKHYPALLAQLEELVIDADGCLIYGYRGNNIRIKRSILKGFAGEYLSLRREFYTAFPETLTELNIPLDQKQKLAQLVDCKSGLVFVAARNDVDRCHFMELLLRPTDLEQRVVLGLGASFGKNNATFPCFPLPYAQRDQADLIIASLEHEPEILMIEEATRLDASTAAAFATLGGRKVIAGLTLQKLKNVLTLLLQNRRYIPLLSSIMKGIVVFRSINLLCKSCRHEYAPTQATLNSLALEQQPARFYRASGCDACNFSGIGEQRVLFDLLYFDDELIKLLAGATSAEEFITQLGKRGYQGINHGSAMLLQNGVVSPEEFLAAVT
jgi:type II secretory ATPase GspE/PulE/Tfp pilus assembly ATPase PilB-like protein